MPNLLTIMHNGQKIPVPAIKGDPGKDGLTPHIGDNGNWWLGDEDTGVSAGGGGSTGGGGGNASLFEVEVTLEEAVVRMDFSIPVSWYKVKIFNMFIDFGTVETGFSLQTIFGGEYKTLRDIEVGNGVGLDVYGVKHYYANGFSMALGYSKLSADAARPSGFSASLFAKDTNTVALKSNTADVLIPSGTKVILWGVYTND